MTYDEAKAAYYSLLGEVRENCDVNIALLDEAIELERTFGGFTRG